MQQFCLRSEKKKHKMITKQIYRLEGWKQGSVVETNLVCQTKSGAKITIFNTAKCKKTCLNPTSRLKQA